MNNRWKRNKKKRESVQAERFNIAVKQCTVEYLTPILEQLKAEMLDETKSRQEVVQGIDYVLNVFKYGENYALEMYENRE